MDNIDKIIKLVKICMKKNIQFNLERTGDENKADIDINNKKCTLYLPDENDPRLNELIFKSLVELEQLVE